MIDAPILRCSELLDRYAKGERRFASARLSKVRIDHSALCSADISGIDLSLADLRGIDLRGADLTWADLSCANLAGADLRTANLEGAFLTDANLEGANLADAFMANAYVRGANLRATNLNRTNLSGATAIKADFAGASAHGTELTKANLFRANLTGADLEGATLDRADLSEAECAGAIFSLSTLNDTRLYHARLNKTRFCKASLRDADLREADLTDADLSGADLTNADLSGAKLRGLLLSDSTRIGRTVLVDVELESFCRVEVVHMYPSHVDFRTLLASVNQPRLKEFLRRAGMPDVFIEYMVDCARSLNPEHVFTLLQSTFISYGGPDEAFAKKLNDALESRGVTTFFFKEDAKPGEKLHRTMKRGVNEHDRTILICSKSSLQRHGLLNELEETLAREARDGGREYLIPVRLDDFVIDSWAPTDPGIAQSVRDRVIADFRNHSNPDEFDIQLARLISALRKPTVHF